MKKKKGAGSKPAAPPASGGAAGGAAGAASAPKKASAAGDGEGAEKAEAKPRAAAPNAPAVETAEVAMQQPAEMQQQQQPAAPTAPDVAGGEAGASRNAASAKGFGPPMVGPNGAVVSRKTTACRFFAQGKCKNGDNCTFRHDGADLPPRPASREPKTPSAPQQPQGKQAQQPQQPPPQPQQGPGRRTPTSFPALGGEAGAAATGAPPADRKKGKGRLDGRSDLPSISAISRSEEELRQLAAVEVQRVWRGCWERRYVVVLLAAVRSDRSSSSPSNISSGCNTPLVLRRVAEIGHEISEVFEGEASADLGEGARAAPSAASIDASLAAAGGSDAWGDRPAEASPTLPPLGPNMFGNSLRSAPESILPDAMRPAKPAHRGAAGEAGEESEVLVEPDEGDEAAVSKTPGRLRTTQGSVVESSHAAAQPAAPTESAAAAGEAEDAGAKKSKRDKKREKKAKPAKPAADSAPRHAPAENGAADGPSQPAPRPRTPVAEVAPPVDSPAPPEPTPVAVQVTGKFCTQCGELLQASWKFCANCGSPRPVACVPTPPESAPAMPRQPSPMQPAPMQPLAGMGAAPMCSYASYDAPYDAREGEMGGAAQMGGELGLASGMGVPIGMGGADVTDVSLANGMGVPIGMGVPHMAVPRSMAPHMVPGMFAGMPAGMAMMSVPEQMAMAQMRADGLAKAAAKTAFEAAALQAAAAERGAAHAEAARQVAAAAEAEPASEASAEPQPEPEPEAEAEAELPPWLRPAKGGFDEDAASDFLKSRWTSGALPVGEGAENGVGGADGDAGVAAVESGGGMEVAGATSSSSSPPTAAAGRAAAETAAGGGWGGGGGKAAFTGGGGHAPGGATAGMKGGGGSHGRGGRGRGGGRGGSWGGSRGKSAKR